MTTHESNSSLRVRIAKSQGWTDIREEKMTYVDYDSRSVSEWTELRGTLSGKRDRLPNWPEDLNSCAQFEAGLTNTQKIQYAGQIWKMVDIAASSFPVIHATARQRCLAYLATINPEEWK